MTGPDVAAGVGRTAPAALQGVVRRDAPGEQRRRHAAEEHGRQRDHGSEAQHAPVHRDGRPAVGRRRRTGATAWLPSRRGRRRCRRRPPPARIPAAPSGSAAVARRRGRCGRRTRGRDRWPGPAAGWPGSSTPPAARTRTGRGASPAGRARSARSPKPERARSATRSGRSPPVRRRPPAQLARSGTRRPALPSPRDRAVRGRRSCASCDRRAPRRRGSAG